MAITGKLARDLAKRFGFEVFPEARKHKYGAVATTVDGHRFASKKEAKRYGELRLLEKIGAISDLTLQPRFDIVVNGIKVCTYVGDFRYLNSSLEVTIEDVKGMRTQEYLLKKKLMKAVFGIDIKEV